MIRRAALIAAMALALAGCVDTQSSAPASRNDIRPGPHQVDGVDAMMMFKRICVEPSPTFADTRSIIATLPFQQHPATGTYYHRNLDLSVKLTPVAGGGVCSMVFASKDESSQLALMMSLAGASFNDSNRVGSEIFIDPDASRSSTNLAGGAQLVFHPLGRKAGKNYYKAAITTAN